MQERLKTAVLGGLAGAVLTVALLAVSVVTNIVPAATDARIKSYLLANPKLVVEMQVLAEAQIAEEERQAQLAKIKQIGLKKFFDPKVAFVTGPANAKNSIVAFYDYNCGHCRSAATVLKAWYQKHKADTRYAFIEFPIFGDESMNAARASVAARQQGDKFLALHFGLMAEKGAIDQAMVLAAAQKAGLDINKLAADLTSPQTEKSILAGYRLAREMKFGGTPMFIVNGQVHEGEVTEEDLKKLTK